MFLQNELRQCEECHKELRVLDFFFCNICVAKYRDTAENVVKNLTEVKWHS